MIKTKNIALLGIMLAVVIVLTALEHMMPPIPFLPPGVKLGLSNIVIMYCVFFIGKPQSVTLAALKSLFVFLTRGAVAGILSFTGGMLSIAVIILLLYLFKERISIAAISIVGAITHNIGQLTVYSIIMNTFLVFSFYTPILIVSGVIMGIVTGTLLKLLLPLMRKVLR
jgi:heptaprenyl diphosphate synthase